MHWYSLPHPRLLGLGLRRGPLIPGPLRPDGKLLRVPGHVSGAAHRGRGQADDVRRRWLGVILAQVRAVGVGGLVLGIRLDHRPIRCQPSHDVPVGRPLAPELLGLPAQRPMQIGQHQMMQLIPDRRLIRRLQHNLEVCVGALTLRQNNVPSGANNPPSSRTGAVVDAARARSLPLRRPPPLPGVQPLPNFLLIPVMIQRQQLVQHIHPCLRTNSEPNPLPRLIKPMCKLNLPPRR